MIGHRSVPSLQHTLYFVCSKGHVSKILFIGEPTPEEARKYAKQRARRCARGIGAEGPGVWRLCNKETVLLSHVEEAKYRLGGEAAL